MNPVPKRNLTTSRRDVPVEPAARSGLELSGMAAGDGRLFQSPRRSLSPQKQLYGSQQSAVERRYIAEENASRGITSDDDLTYLQMNQLDLLRRDLQRAESEAAQLTERLAEKTAALELERQENDGLRAKNERLLEERNACTEENAAAQAKIDQQALSYQKLIDQYHMAQDENYELKKQAISLNDKLKARDAELQNRAAEIQNKTQQIQLLTEDLDNQKYQYSLLQQQLEHSKRSTDNINIELAHKITQVNDLQHQLSQVVIRGAQSPRASLETGSREAQLRLEMQGLQQQVSDLKQYQALYFQQQTEIERLLNRVEFMESKLKRTQ